MKQNPHSKLISLGTLRQAYEDWDPDRDEPLIAITNGCFDILHWGHVAFLNKAGQGRFLIVGINGDASVKALKGDGRPINSEEQRALVVASLECVDMVVIFPEIRATEFIRACPKESTYFKSGEYTIESLNREEKAVLDERGCKIVILPPEPGLSTTRILAKVKA
jgi:rfaE bifunctional protein nucleotidyltransferase chain/domain